MDTAAANASISKPNVMDDVEDAMVEDTCTCSHSDLLISVDAVKVIYSNANSQLSNFNMNDKFANANPEPERIIKRRRKNGWNGISERKDGKSKKNTTNPILPTEKRSTMISPLKT